MSFITSIGTANPKNKINQKQIAEFMVTAMNLHDEEADQLRILYRASGIETRYSVIEDYGNNARNGSSFFSSTKTLEPFPKTKQRLEFFKDQSIKLSLEAAQQCLATSSSISSKSITHLIVVSCTGMFAPGLDIDLISKLNLDTTIQRTSINFMGCYAAFNALRVADSFCKSNGDAKVLIVCTEICSLHFQKENTEDNKLANALFADGSAAVLVESKGRDGLSLKIESSYCDIALEGEDDMAWSIGDHGFEMKLSSYVPDVIKKGIKKLTASLLQKNELLLSDVDYFAIHPGGKKILETVEKELGLSKNQNIHAHQIMKEYGNMSSPTVLFVLKRIFSKLTSHDHNKKILSFGFGPGLTMESLILTVNSQ